MKNIYLLLVLAGLSISSVLAEIKIIKPSVSESSSFAIVVDKSSYEKVESPILDYKKAVEEIEHLSTYIIIVNNETPDVIREELQKLYSTEPKLEGAVFVGDIPIPMIRGAQHLTSAFKMSEKRDWIESSVPSDRFYDDFDLQFQYLKQDSSNSLLYYYELLPESPQKIQKDIYSGRIKPPVDDETKYSMISDYLAKVVEAKKNPELLDNGFVFSGHGYHSESLTAWNDESISLHEQFPLMFEVGGRLKHIRASMSDNKMKEIIMMELSKKEVDLAIFHAHGVEDRQLLVGYPAAESIGENSEAIRRFLRSKIRTFKERGRDVEEAKNSYKTRYNLTEEWFEGTFEDSVIAADSIYDYSMDMYSDDLALFSPQSEFVIFDECFNGAFHVENYISGRYLFGSGNVIASIAGSIGVLQDLWANQFLGLLEEGVSVGNWFMENHYLEHHIIGDPTFHFKSTNKIDLNKKIVEEANNVEFWQKLLNAPEADVRALAVSKMYSLLGDKFIPQLVNIYKNDISYNVRARAFYALADTRSEEFLDLLTVSINDPYEYIRRISGKLMGNTGSDRYIPYMINAIIHDEGKRVAFGTSMALELMDPDKVLEEADKIILSLPDFIDKDSYKRKFENVARRNQSRLNDEIIPMVTSDTLTQRKRLFNIRILRNSDYKGAIDPLLEVVKDKNAPIDIRTALVEAFGWYYYSEKRGTIIKAMDELISKNNLPEEIKNEAVKTKNRLVEGPNVPITP